MQEVRDRVDAAVADSRNNTLFQWRAGVVTGCENIKRTRGGVRTLETLRLTRFPGVPFQPLTHLSSDSLPSLLAVLVGWANGLGVQKVTKLG